MSQESSKNKNVLYILRYITNNFHRFFTIGPKFQTEFKLGGKDSIFF